MIKAGYQLHITSWENDGDHYQTKIIDGLNVYDCKFIIELCSLFKSANSASKGFGNKGATEYGDKYHNYHNSRIEDIKVAVEGLLNKHIHISEILLEDISETLNQIFDGWWAFNELMYDRFLGNTVEYQDETNFFRVFDSFKVYYYEVDVPEVTNEFLK